jgi:sigma-B regulation protein RsbU (phosphoserine phosphatase)
MSLDSIPEPQGASGGGDTARPLSGPPRILVVDDEPGVQNAVRRILARRYQISVADDAPQALELLAASDHDLAIVDIRMPGMNGFELLKAIKAAHPDTEVIIMTGSISNPEEKLVEALRERAFYFINKPFERTVLETLVERCLDRQRLERQNRAYTRLLEADLEQARAFQHMLLPRHFPRLPGLRGAVRYEASERLSGDFYDFYDLGARRLGVLIADVAGHGVSAALYTGILKSELHVAREEFERPEKLFEDISERLRRVARQRYITAQLLLLDLESRQLRWVNAGHPGFIDSAGDSAESTGPPLGMLPGARYEVHTRKLPAGERLLLYTDGVSEAMRAGGVDFGLERVRDHFRQTRKNSPELVVEGLLGAAREFAGRSQLEDDATAIVLEIALELED